MADHDLPPLLGESPAFMALTEQISRVAPLDRPVLVIGERGTGKELVAARLHFLSRRWGGPFVKLNCAALAESLLETELFDHEAGAFTGAVKRRSGRFEIADGGSLFLDEIAAASQAVQEKLLRAIEYGAFERVGGNATLTVDVRVIGATNEDLPAAAAAGRFRADLLDRLAFEVITLPPLRARPEDIPLLARHFGRAMAKALDWPQFPDFSEAAMGGGGGQRHGVGGGPGRREHQVGAGGRRGRGGVPRRPAGPPGRGGDHRAAAARPAGGHPAAGPALRAGDGEGARLARVSRLFRGGHGAAAGPLLAGKRARAAQRGGALRRPRQPRRGDRRRGHRPLRQPLSHGHVSPDHVGGICQGAAGWGHGGPRAARPIGKAPGEEKG